MKTAIFAYAIAAFVLFVALSGCSYNGPVVIHPRPVFVPRVFVVPPPLPRYYYPRWHWYYY